MFGISRHVLYQPTDAAVFQCRTEYKIPGLYVIDSIVRQSRHQFGVDRDVFAPRFAKNLSTTFYHIFKCPAEDKVSALKLTDACLLFNCLNV